MADLNTQFPSWLAQREWFSRENRSGQEFLQGAQLGANIASRQREQEYQNRALQLQRDAFELKRETQLQSNEGMVALGQTLSGIANTGDWASPEAEAKFWDTVTRYPAVTHSPNFDNLAGIFERAKQAKLQRDLAQQRMQKEFAPGPLEKDISYYQRVLAEGDPEIVDLTRSILQSKAQKSGFSVKFGPGGTVESVDYGPQAKPGQEPGTPTIAFKTQLQQQLHSYDNSMALLEHVEKNMSASDFGLRGMAKELTSRIGGQFGLNVPPEQLDVRNSLKQLRQDLFKALRSDSNITGEEKKSIERMLPEVEMFDVAESLPNAVGKLLTVKRTLQEKSRTAAERLGVLPPLWTLSNDEIASAVAAGKLERDKAKQFLMENR